jgi:type VI secretion system protein ImpC
MTADADSTANLTALLDLPLGRMATVEAAPDTLPDALHPAAAALAVLAAQHPALVAGGIRRTIEALIGEVDRQIDGQLNVVLHHPDFQAMETAWRGLHFLVRGIEPETEVKVRVLDISKRELGRTLRKFRGTAWDQSPIFKKIYEEEYGQLGGQPFGVLIGDYAFDHRPEDVLLLTGISMVAAAAHCPFIAAAAPSLMQMDSWSELANPRELTRIFMTPEYTAWRSLRESEDARYLGLCVPRVLARLPYGARTDPTDGMAFEEEVEGPDTRAYAWMNSAYAMGANIARAFSMYGWCSRIYGIETGGIVDDLPTLHFPTADGETDLKCVTEIALSERREAELARAGLMPLVHRKNSDFVAFVSAHSLQRPLEYEDPAATANAVMSARLPYLFASCRFAHYLKCLVRDKVGGTMTQAQLQSWLNSWIRNYIDGSPGTSSEAWKASHPLAAAQVVIEEKPDKPGEYEAKFFLSPHYQLEGLTVALRLVSRIPAS